MLGLTLIMLLQLAPPVSVAQSVSPKNCEPGLRKAPVGDFALWVFCEDALGTQIGVVYAGNMASPRKGNWSLVDRFWQEEPWAMDAEMIAWSEDGLHLFVATGGVYGTASLYHLNLAARGVDLLHGSPLDHDVEIVSVGGGVVRYRSINLTTKKFREHRIKLKRKADG